MTRRVAATPDTLLMFDLCPPSVERGEGTETPVENGGDSPLVGYPTRTASSPTLPPVLDVETAGRLLGLGRSAAYELVKAGAWPTPVLRLGRRWRVLTAPLLALLEIDGLQSSAVDGRLHPSPTAPAIFRHDQGDQR